jgi:hypothetical protein
MTLQIGHLLHIPLLSQYALVVVFYTIVGIIVLIPHQPPGHLAILLLACPLIIASHPKQFVHGFF